MELIENREEWEPKYREWAANAVPLIEKRDMKGAFSTYPFVVNNESIIAQPGKNISEGRVALISSSGAFIVKNQEPFDSGNPLGDPSYRLIPKSSSKDDISFRHEQYSKEFATVDPEVVLPIWLMKELEAEKHIGELFDPVLSFQGYIPNPAYFLDTTGEELVKILSGGDVDFALLILV